MSGATRITPTVFAASPKGLTRIDQALGSQDALRFVIGAALHPQNVAGRIASGKTRLSKAADKSYRKEIIFLYTGIVIYRLLE